MEEKKYIIFTDLKDFTYKNTLLTNSQVESILADFDSIIREASQLFDVELIKSIGDAYFAVSTSIGNTYKFAHFILEKSLAYDATRKISIKKISLRVTITYGSVARRTALNLEDYFGEAINLGARIMDMTPENMIFCTQSVFQSLPPDTKHQFLGNFSFHGVIYEIPLYSLTLITDQEILLLKQSQDSALKICEDTVFRASCVSGILSAQPIPFLENLNVIAVHLYMIVKISGNFGNTLSLRESSKVFSELIAPLGLSFLALQGSGTLVKILLPGIGGYIYAPVSFGVSYALGRIYIMYFYYKQSGEILTPDIIKELFKKQRKEGIKIAKSQKNTILAIGKKYSREVLDFQKDKNFKNIQKDTIRMLQSKKDSHDSSK